MKHLNRTCLTLAVLALASACTEQVASTYVVTKDITAASGGTVEVTSKESADLAGAKLEIPAGALAKDTKITVAFQKDAIAPAAEAAGPVAEFGPSGTAFSKPVKVTLPYKLAGTQKLGNLYVQVLEDSGTKSILAGTADAATSLVTFEVSHFTRYQAAAHPSCSANADCEAGEACVDGVCTAQTACTPGQDQSCNGDPMVSSLWGHCETDGTCTCKSGFAADAATGKCMPNACAANADCGAGQKCVSGKCELVCPSGQTSCSGLCVDLQSSTANCGQCALACGAGMTCTRGVCVAGSTCSADSQCAAGEACVSGKCVAQSTTCEAAGGKCGALTATGVICDAGYALNGSAGTCAPGGGCCTPTTAACAANNDCSIGEVCIAGKCAVGCEAAGGKCGALTASGVICDPGYDADETAGSCGMGGGCCVPTQTGCLSDADCGVPLLCVAGVCELSCEAAGGSCGALTASGVTCPAGMVANGAAGSCAPGGGCCVPAYVTCATNADCLTGKVCVNGLCEGGCGAGQTMCGSVCADLGSNSANCGGCGNACAAGETCTAGTCVAGSTCSSDADCGAGEACMSGACVAAGLTCELAGGKCGALTAAGIICDAGYEANGSAGTCAIGGSCCTPAASVCASDADCSIGQACMAGKCEVTCEAVGGRCGALTASGVVCDAGYVADGSAGTCGIGGSCCMPTTPGCSADSDCATGQLCMLGQCELTCVAAGGTCGALTASGVTCGTGYVSSGSAGACAPGGGCCMPASSVCSTNADCGTGEVCIAGICK